MSFTQDLAWNARHMLRTANVVSQLQNCEGKRLAVSTHLDIKMVSFYEGYLKQGGELFLTTCNPTTVRDEVVEYLVSLGAEASAWKNMSESDWQASLQKALDWKPTHLCEFGAQLGGLYHASSQTSGVVASLEGTGSGVSVLDKMPLKHPVFNWDDLDAKEGLHNRHMVGLSAWQAFMERTHLSLHEKKVVIIGYGLVGQGCAASAKSFGGQVIVAENDPSRLLQAAYDGWHTASLNDVIAQADVVVTATGVAGVLSESMLSQLKVGAFVMNVGHVSHEIRLDAMTGYQVEEVMPEIYEYRKGEHYFYALSNGAMFNLTAGYGDSLNAFDVSLALMAAGVKHMFEQSDQFENGMHILPDQAWKPFL
ncbi:NAD(P)-dependent oxidoreductase [Marinomonas sp. GJ51-6]|uniref:NAD(P)-dependent oxidoreductase n=1 Tax=Marinomonas sp. GJ51-6 TaxID=2992802 RepID=UPI002934F811|nr:NAD(P)-dependent oxidoreductase [Marinomonas sp. GJ51-6]WOD07899.1 NAD(P)-dependent oxidoreductase [Marinomonas sp. GJ51-6]